MILLYIYVLLHLDAFVPSSWRAAVWSRGIRRSIMAGWSWWIAGMVLGY